MLEELMSLFSKTKQTVDKASRRWHQLKMAAVVFGFILVIMGALFLLENLGLISPQVWDVFWPALLILVGVLIIIMGMKR